MTLATPDHFSLYISFHTVIPNTAHISRARGTAMLTWEPLSITDVEEERGVFAFVPLHLLVCAVLGTAAHKVLVLNRSMPILENLVRLHRFWELQGVPTFQESASGAGAQLEE